MHSISTGDSFIVLSVMTRSKLKTLSESIRDKDNRANFRDFRQYKRERCKCSLVKTFT
jgi:hypothetical protein